MPFFDDPELIAEKEREENANFVSEATSSDFTIAITETQTVSSGYFGMSSYTLYKLETRCSLPGYDPNVMYSALRRFSDFTWLHDKLSATEAYKGFIIPSLPQKKYIFNFDPNFIEQRKNELEEYLNILAGHKFVRFDPQLKTFLTVADPQEFED